MRTRRRRIEGRGEDASNIDAHIELLLGTERASEDLRGSFRARYGDEAGGAHLVRALEGRGSGPGALATRAAPAL